jgi:hypothetical protein
MTDATGDVARSDELAPTGEHPRIAVVTAINAVDA